MTQASEQIARQFANANYNKRIWGDIFFNVKAFGAVGDGITDDTQAIQSAIDAAYSNGSGTVGFPPGTYLCGDLTMRDKVSLYAFPSPFHYLSQIGYVTLKAKPGATYILNVAGVKGFGVHGILFNGSDRTSNGISSGGETGWIQNCKFEMCDTGIGKFNTKYLLTTYIEACMFEHCNKGIENIADSKILESFIYACRVGIALATGANANIISDNKIEWNFEEGVSLYQCLHNIISNNVIDRNGNTGILVYDCDHITISGNMFMRNGATTTNSNRQNHIYILESQNVDFVGNVTKKTTINDDGSGGMAPKKTMRIENSSNIIIIGNDLTGYVDTLLENVNNTKLLVNDNAGTTNSGLFTGNGGASFYSIPHGLTFFPGEVHVLPASADACGDFFVTVDTTNLYVQYKSATPSGSNNVLLRWSADY